MLGVIIWILNCLLFVIIALQSHESTHKGLVFSLKEIQKVGVMELSSLEFYSELSRFSRLLLS